MTGERSAGVPSPAGSACRLATRGLGLRGASRRKASGRKAGLAIARIALVGWAAALAASTLVARAEEAANASDSAVAAPPLDQQLLRGLDVDRLREPVRQPSGEGGGAMPREDDQPAAQGDPPRLPGENRGDQTEHPLESIGRRMRQAESLLAANGPPEPAQQLQLQIVDDLQRLIDQLAEQSRGGQGRGSNTQQPPGGKPAARPQAGNGEPAGDAQAAAGSEGPRAPGDRDEDARQRLQRAMKQVWGHLPERVREQLQGGLTEEFLPQYEQLIGRYYTRLAEEGQP